VEDALSQFALTVLERLRLGIPQRGDDFSAPNAEAPQRSSGAGDFSIVSETVPKLCDTGSLEFVS